MRKFLSIVLAVRLIICIFPINDIKVNAVTETLTLNQSQTITVVEEQNTVLKFTPSKTGYYSLASSSNDDLYCTLYEGAEEIAFNDDGGGLKDFCIKAKLQAGVTYTYEISIFYGVCNNATVKLEECTYVKDIEPGRGVSYGKEYIADGDARIATVPIGYADGYIRRLAKN